MSLPALWHSAWPPSETSRGGSRPTGRVPVRQRSPRRLGPHRKRTMGRKSKTVDLDRDNDIAPGLVAKTKKRLVVAGGRSHPDLSADVATALGTQLVPTEYRTFASGEILTRFEVSIRGCDFFLIQSFGPPVNEWLMETLIMLDAAKRASAKRITVVAPY